MIHYLIIFKFSNPFFSTRMVSNIAVKGRFYNRPAAAELLSAKKPAKTGKSNFLSRRAVLQASFPQYTWARGEAHIKGHFPKWASPHTSV